MSADDAVAVVEIIAPTFPVTEIVAIDPGAGLVEVRDTDAVLVSVASLVDVVGIVTPELVGPAGPQGAQGDPGPAGPAGPQGPTGPFAPTFEQHFASASLIWVIAHNLNTYPVVTTVDLNGDEIVGDVLTPDRNTVIVTYAVPMAGTARLKA